MSITHIVTLAHLCFHGNDLFLPQMVSELVEIPSATEFSKRELRCGCNRDL